jgi:hypothetical protein
MMIVGQKAVVPDEGIEPPTFGLQNPFSLMAPRLKSLRMHAFSSCEPRGSHATERAAPAQKSAQQNGEAR